MTHTNATAAQSAHDRAWDRQDVAHYLRISIRQLSDLRHEDPTFPAPRMVGTKPIWVPRTIETWVEQPALPRPRKASDRGPLSVR